MEGKLLIVGNRLVSRASLMFFTAASICFLGLEGADPQQSATETSKFERAILDIGTTAPTWSPLDGPPPLSVFKAVSIFKERIEKCMPSLNLNSAEMEITLQRLNLTDVVASGQSGVWIWRIRAVQPAVSGNALSARFSVRSYEAALFLDGKIVDNVVDVDEEKK